LRIKIAAAIALIEIGHTDGVGRHPGLLFIDSPAAEEIPEADLRTMLEAIATVAAEDRPADRRRHHPRPDAERGRIGGEPPGRYRNELRVVTRHAKYMTWADRQAP
jgi:hypothetical protein